MTFQREDNHRIIIDGIDGYWDSLSGGIGPNSTIVLSRARDVEAPYRNDLFQTLRRVVDRPMAFCDLTVQQYDGRWVKETIRAYCRVVTIDMLNGDSNSDDLAFDSIELQVLDIVRPTEVTQ